MLKTETPSISSEANEIQEEFDLLIKQIKKYNKNADFDKITRAYELACEAHKLQKRVAGGPYVIHPLKVAHILSDMSLDSDSITAALLHDVVEDTDVTLDDIKSKFGKDVADLVDGVTKLGRMPYSSKEEQQIENLRKMFLAMAKDIRVLLIKLADRLHNMRTISSMPEEKQRQKALETIEVYSPLAHRLGIQKIKTELEDISIKILDPIACKEIEDNIAKKMVQNEAFLSSIEESVKKRLDEAGLKHTISSRAKHIYSIYRKMYTQNRSFDEIYDLFAIRIIVDETVDCYNVLGIMHDMYKPIPRRFKDYISTPKPNMYQSLHTTVIGKAGVAFEVQIRTKEMDEVAEMGIAAHWKYKQNITDKKAGENLIWVRQLLEIQKESEDPDDLMRALKIDMFADEVFVFTPAGDVLNLPQGSTIIDFAYAIHSGVGNNMSGGKVNGRIVPIDSVLHNGDIVEIIRSSSSHGPSLDWLKMCKTSGARNKIRQWFKKEKRDENITRGKNEFEKEIKRNGLSLNDVLKDEIRVPLLNRFSAKSIEDLYAGIGYGGFSLNKVILKVLSEVDKQKKQQEPEPPAELTAPETAETHHTKNYKGILVEGMDNCLIKLAHCCNPLPGDEVVGFITRGFGVSVHKKNCVNVVNNTERDSNQRWVKVSWTQTSETLFTSTLQIVSRDRLNIVADVINLFSTMKIKTSSINARETKDGFTLINVSIEIKSLAQLEFVMNKLSRIQGVIDVVRGMQ